METEKEVYYRYEDYRESTGYLDICGEYEITGSRTRISVRTYPVLKHTPKGVWLRAPNDFSDKRFVLHSATKRFADSTIERALESFKARKRRQKSIYLARAKQAEEAIQIAEAGKHRLTADLFGGYFL